MSLSKLITGRSINEILHFTRSDNFTGIVALGRLVPRESLSEEKYIQHVNDPVWPDRSRDCKWWSFLNLSVESINETLLNKVRPRYPKCSWFVAAFSPEILNHEGVYFTTTNNAYETVKRQTGIEGFELMYSGKVQDRLGNWRTRDAELPAQFPTSQQAELLYPGPLSLKYLRAIYVEDQCGFQRACSIMHSASFSEDPAACVLDIVPEIKPEKFHAHKRQVQY